MAIIGSVTPTGSSEVLQGVLGFQNLDDHFFLQKKYMCYYLRANWILNKKGTSTYGSRPRLVQISTRSLRYEFIPEKQVKM